MAPFSNQSFWLCSKIKLIQVATLLSSSLFVFGPAQTYDKDYRNVIEPLSISMVKTSPSFAAIEDTMNSWGDEADKKQINYYEEKLQAGEGEITSTELVEVKKADFRSMDVLQISTKKPPNIYKPDGSLLPLNERKEKLAQHFSEYDTSGVSVQNLAQKLVQQELQLMREEKEKEQREQLVLRGGKLEPKIIVRKPKETQHNGYGQLQNSGLGKAVAQKKENREKSEPEVVEKAVKIAGEGGGFENDLTKRIVPAFFPLEEKPNYQYTISGQLTMEGGVAYTGYGDELKIYQLFRGNKINQGKIWLQQGRYEIVVNKMAGHLVAELTNSSKEVIGYSEVDLYNFSEIPYNQNHIPDINLKVLPAEIGLSLSVISGRSYSGNKIHIKDAKVYIEDLGREVVVNEEGIYRDAGIQNDSSYILNISKKGFWDSLMLGSAGKTQEVKLFPKKMVEALYSWANKTDLIKDSGVLWGRVEREGRAVSGVSLEIAGADILPLYFKNYSGAIQLPDSQLKQTGKSGEFTFVGLEEKEYSIRAFIDGAYYPTEIVPVVKGKVTYLIVNIQSNRSSSLVLQHFFPNNEVIEANVKVYGADTEFDILSNKVEAIQFAGGMNRMIFEVDGGNEYLLTKHQMRRDQKDIRLSAVEKKRLEDLAQKSNIELDLNLGVIVGQVGGQSFDILIDESAGNKQKMIFLDSEGSIIPQAVAEGSFIIVNVEPGLHTLAIMSAESTYIQTQITHVEAGVASALWLEF